MPWAVRTASIRLSGVSGNSGGMIVTDVHQSFISKIGKVQMCPTPVYHMININVSKLNTCVYII